MLCDRLDPDTRAHVTNDELAKCEKILNLDSDQNVVPPRDKIMAAFEACPWNTIRVVLLGQDPFIQPGQAMGLSFSVPKWDSRSEHGSKSKHTKVPPSTVKIYECLTHCGLIPHAPLHGDLSSWAKQGVLLLNCALTTVAGKSAAHMQAWAPYTDWLITKLAVKGCIFLLLGAFAHKKANLHGVAATKPLVWGHPSPLNSANNRECPENFKYCDVFTKCNDRLIAEGSSPINWASVCDVDINPVICTTQPPSTTFQDETILSLDSDALLIDGICPTTIDTLWVFADGGALANGKAGCTASYAYYMTDGCSVVKCSGSVFPPASNNRGELLAIIRAIWYLVCHVRQPESNITLEYSRVVVVSDSQYAINSLDTWGSTWISRGITDKKNLDLVGEGVKLLAELRQRVSVTFKHIRGHGAEPKDSESEEWFLWKGNMLVDAMCGLKLADGKKQS